MLRTTFFLLSACCCFLIFSACGTSPSSSGSGGSGNNSGAGAAEAQAAARAALDRMDGGGLQGGAVGGSSSSQKAATAPSTNTPSSSASSTQQGTTVNTGKAKPAWVDSVDSAYNRNQYVAAMGVASDRTMSERNALVNLVAYVFGQSIDANMEIINTYNETVRKGVTTAWTDNVAMKNAIEISVATDSPLLGAEVREVWFDSKNTWYAVAVMEKSKIASLYTEMINANKNIINNLITMNQTEKNSLEGFSRYQFAATVADTNITYGNVLRIIDAPIPGDLIKGDNYRIEAQNITKTIPIGITVKNDKSGRVQGAFAKSLSALGFRSGGTNSRYVLDVSIDNEPVEFPGNSNKFSRMALGANLTDTSQRAVLFPYNFTPPIREGALTQSEAENRTYVVAERKINDEYSKLLSEYLSRLLPQKQ
jgi:hypothetical protein